MSFESEVERLAPLFEKGEHHYPTARALEDEAGRICDALEAGDAEAVDAALAFLSIRRKPFRSGYACTRIARRIKRAPLIADQQAALRRILFDRLTWPFGHTRDVWNCYTAVRTAEADAALRKLAESPTPWIARRAKGILARLP